MGREGRSRHRMVWIFLASLGLLVAWCADAQAQDDGTLPFPEAQRRVNEEYIPDAHAAMERQGNTGVAALWQQGIAGQPLLQYQLFWSDEIGFQLSPRYILVPVEHDTGLIGLVGIDPYTGQFRWRMGHVSREAETPIPPEPEELSALIARAGYLSSDFLLHDLKLLYAGFQNYWYIPKSSGKTADGLILAVGGQDVRQLTALGLEQEHTGFEITTHPLPSTPVAELKQLPQAIEDQEPGFDHSDEASSATGMIGAIPYYTQDCSLWCWAASLSMLHQWWSPQGLGTSYAQQSEIARYAKGSIACAGGSADDIYRTVRNWQSVDSSYEGFQTAFKGEGTAFEIGDPSGYNNDPKTWIAHLQAPVIAFVDTTGNGKANHAIVIVGYDDFDGEGVVYLHDPWYSNWWPGHGGEPCYDLAVSYSHFDAKWNVTWEGLLFTGPSGLDTSKKRGMVTGVPGDNSFARIGVTSLQMSGPIDDGASETAFDLGLGALDDNTAALYDSFGHFHGSGVSAELADPAQADITVPVLFGDFVTYNPTLPNSTINLVTGSIQEDDSHGGASFEIDPRVVGLIGLEATWWVYDEDDRWHSDAVISVLDDRGGSNTSFDMYLPELVEDTQGPGVYQFNVEDDDESGPAVADYTDSGDAAPGYYSFRIRLNDPSGILDDPEFPRLYFRWDSEEIDETHHDGYLNADWDGAWYTAGMVVEQEKLGHRLYWRSLAYDDDDDREEDRSEAWSPVYGGGTIIEGSPADAPVNVDASDGTFPDKVLLAWQAVPGADQYAVFRTTSPGDPREPLANTDSTSYEDATAAVGIHYFYSVKACNSIGCSGFSAQDIGFLQGTSPPVPDDVEASDGLFPERVRVTWDPAPGASHYQVHRATSPQGPRTELGSPVAPPYDDTSAGPDTTYYYWVLACNNAGCSDWSAYDTGYRSHLPFSMQAGMTGPAITHAWQHVSFPTAFLQQPVLVAQISTENGGDNAHIDLAYVSHSGFYVRVEEDLGRDGIHNKPEDVHWLAVPPGDYGTFKAGKTGEIVTHEWRRVTFPSPFTQTPILVAQLVTENGLDNSHIDIMDLSTDGFSVRVEEDMQNDGEHAAESVHWIATIPGQYDMMLAGSTGESVSHLWYPASFPSGFDSAPPVLVAQLISEYGSDNCHVDLRACTKSGFEARVEEDTEEDGSHTEENVHYVGAGIITQGYPPPVPANVQASDGTYASRVHVSWDPAPGASHYQVHRATSPQGPRTELGSPVAPPYDDTSAEPDTTYYYWVLACNNAGCSDWSAYDTGYRSHLPFNMQAGMTGPAITHAWQHVSFPTAFLQQPVLVAQISTENGGDNAHIDLAYVSYSGFYVRVEEDLGRDGIHNKPEDVHWLAVPPGDYGTFKAGKTGEIVTHEWRRVTFPTPFTQTPILVAQIVTENGLDNSHIDIMDLSTDGFSVRVEEDMQNDGEHAAESVHWIATIPGQYDMMLAGSTGDSVSHLWYPASFPSGFDSAPPVLVAQLISENGSDNCHVDLRACTESGFEARVEEDTEADGSHTEEEVHFIAIAW